MTIPTTLVEWASERVAESRRVDDRLDLADPKELTKKYQEQAALAKI